MKIGTKNPTVRVVCEECGHILGEWQVELPDLWQHMHDPHAPTPEVDVRVELVPEWSKK